MPISIPRLLWQCFLVFGLGFFLAHLIFGDARLIGWHGAYTTFFIAVFDCVGWRIVARSRLTVGFGMSLKAIAIPLILLPVAAYFGYVHLTVISQVWLGTFGVILLWLGDDIVERPAAPQLTREIFGREDLMANAMEVDRALKTKTRPFDPSFPD